MENVKSSISEPPPRINRTTPEREARIEKIIELMAGEATHLRVDVGAIVAKTGKPDKQARKDEQATWHAASRPLRCRLETYTDTRTGELVVRLKKGQDVSRLSIKQIRAELKKLGAK
jgi:hypothetical protein